MPGPMSLNLGLVQIAALSKAFMLVHGGDRAHNSFMSEPDSGLLTGLLLAPTGPLSDVDFGHVPVTAFRGATRPMAAAASYSDA